ncbi:MAG: hypothetical protein H6609_17910 [Ignavibacteriales bacterium]|nr:hypothetical protein [Ignavibacteriales bacterium]
MENKTYFNICVDIPEDKLAKIISEVLKTNRNVFKPHYKGVSKNFKGFSNYNKVPDQLLTKKILIDCRIDSSIASLLLETWLELKKEFSQKVKSDMMKFGYYPSEPDFNGKGIEYKILSPKNSIIINKKFYCDFESGSISEIDRFNQTLICLIYGWFPFNPETDTEANETELKEQSNNNNDLKVNKNRSLQDYLTDLEDHKNTFNLKKNLVIKTIDALNASINDDVKISEFALRNIIEEYNSELATLRLLLGELSSVIDKNYSEMFKDDEFNFNNKSSVEESFKSAVSKVRLIEKNFKSTAINKYISVSELLSNLDEKQKDEFSKSIKRIKEKYLDDFDLNNITNFKQEIENVEEEIKRDIAAFNLQDAVLEFLQLKSERSIQFLCKHFDNENNYSDPFILFFLILNEGLNIQEKANYLIRLFVEYIKHGSLKNILLLLREDALLEHIIENPMGKKFGALTALILYFLNDKNSSIARLYQNDLLHEYDNYELLKKFVLLIINQEDVIISDQHNSELEEKHLKLKEFFEKKHDYVLLVNNIDSKFKSAIDEVVIPELKMVFNCYEKLNETEIQFHLVKIKKKDYIEELYKEARSNFNLPRNNAIEKKILNQFNNIVSDLIGVSEMKLNELAHKEVNSFNKKELLRSIENFTSESEELKVLVGFINSLIDDSELSSKINFIGEENIDDVTTEALLGSGFFNLYCPELSVYLERDAFDKNNLLRVFLDSFNIENTHDNSIQLLISHGLFGGVDSIRKYLNIELNEDELGNDKHYIEIELQKNEEFINNNNQQLSDFYYKYKRQGRWSLCREEINHQKGKIKEAKERTIELTSEKLKELEKSSVKLNLKIIDEEDNFSNTTYSKIREAIDKIGSIATNKKESKMSIAYEIINEIEQLRKFPNESIEQLEKLLFRIDEDSAPELVGNSKYLNLPLIDLIKYVSDDNYSELGIERKHWQEISGDRKEYIIELIQSWETLKDKPTTKEDIKKSKLNLEKIENELLTLVKSLASICSLYRTNDTLKIGIEPLQDWNYSTDLPFSFTTKIQSPRCSSLDKQIRFFVISKNQTMTKKHISRVKDFILDRKYDVTGFNVFIVLGNDEEFRHNNTYSATRNLPVLGRNELKRIIFSVADKKLPKWELAFLLTLNNKISTIQPFKTQGLVDSNTGIFVGRNEIITKIVNSQKDFAIYGGRRIGKSSLLSILRRNFLDNGYFISYQSFQGLEDSITVAKAIVEDLKARGLKSDSLTPINSFDDFTHNLFNLYRENESKKVIIILDEMDELINREKSNGKHRIIEVFRNISQKTLHSWRFIFAGYKEMYLEINGKGIYEHWQNPWQNFIDDTHMQLGEIESPRELIDEGLKDILGLEYEKEVIDLITNYSTGHPAFLQKFCECLVKSVDNRISPSDRKIYKKDVENVFEKETEFITFVKQTLDLNLSRFQKLITTIAAIENQEVFSSTWIIKKISSWAKDFEINVNLEQFDVNLELELLTITGVVNKTGQNYEYRFSHPHFVKIIRKLENIDKDLVESILKECAEG